MLLAHSKKTCVYPVRSIQRRQVFLDFFSDDHSRNTFKAYGVLTCDV